MMSNAIFDIMPAITVRNLTEEVLRGLKVRAAINGRSTEAEVRAILERAIRPDGEPGVGTVLRNLGQEFGGIDINFKRDPTPAGNIEFD